MHYRELMNVSAPAKINLYLNILGRRPDGFHELETLMCPLELADTMEFTPLPSGIEIVVAGADLSPGPDNLVHRAATALQTLTGTRRGVRIVLHKKIPMGGGLAGGSSNAAKTLLALNTLWECHLPEADLHTLAAGLGSDVNFFLQSGPAICTGRGENIRPVSLSAQPWVLLANPGFGVPTPWAFKTYAALGTKTGTPGHTLPWIDGGLTLRNDLEPAVFTKYLWIAEAKQWLQSQPMVIDSLMSGSGATVFALTETEADARLLLDSARTHFGPACWLQITRLAPSP